MFFWSGLLGGRLGGGDFVGCFLGRKEEGGGQRFGYRVLFGEDSICLVIFF